MAVLSILLATRPMTRWKETRGSKLHSTLIPAALLVALACCITLGCASKPAASDDAAAVEAYATRGYEHHFETTTTRDTWTIDSEPTDVKLILPLHATSYPLVIYLPGLGESADGGQTWRQAWAEAGYAVLSAQTSRYGPVLWSSAAARSGDFLSIAKNAFGVPSLAVRTHFARELLAEVSRRQRAAGIGPMTHIDITQVAVAGYDLGAQTAMMMAGENVPGVEAMPPGEGVKCVIALSPYADFSGMGLESNFRSIQLPVLAVTSMQDMDAFGLLTSASVRRAPFQYMPAGRKYLLLVSGAPHSVFGGVGSSAPAKGKHAGQKTSAPFGDSETDLPVLSDEATVSDKPQRRSNPSEAAPMNGGPASMTRGKEIAQIQSVSAAFLDAMVKGDPIALEWLSRNARAWLGDTADLQSK